MTTGFMKDGKFHPISQSTGKTRKKRLSGEDHPTFPTGIKINKSLHNESIRLKRTLKVGDKVKVNGKKGRVIAGENSAYPTVEFDSGIASSIFIEGIERQKRNDNTVNKNLDIIEGYYVDKKGSLADREQAISEVKKLTGQDPRMFGRTDGDVLKAIRKIRKEHKTRKSRYARDIDPRFTEIKNKKAFIEPLVRNILTKDDDGRDIIMARNFALDFSSPYLYFGVTESGNVKLAEITQFAFKGEPEEVRNFLGKPRLDTGNDTLKISIDGSTFSATIGQNNLSDLLARNKAKGNVK